MALIDKWWAEGTKNFSIRWMRQWWANNGVGMQWGFRTNGAKKNNPKDNCLDVTLSLGYLVITYTNFNLQKKRKC